MTTYNLKTLFLASLAIVGGLAFATPASANAGHNNVTGPSAYDSSSMRSERKVEAETCYTEPTGFHSQIRWDEACRAAKARQRSNGEQSAVSAPSRFMAPEGFHHQVDPR